MPFPPDAKERIKQKGLFTCCWCLNRNNTVDAHHIIPESEGGPHTEDNGAPLCASCHRLFGMNPTLRAEIRRRRDDWYRMAATVADFWQRWPIGADVPRLVHAERLPGNDWMMPAVQLSDLEPGQEGNPVLYISFRALGRIRDQLPEERSLYVEANMRFALNLRTRVSAPNGAHVAQLISFLRGTGTMVFLGPPSDTAQFGPLGSFLYLWCDTNEFRLMVSVAPVPSAGISIHARLSNEAAASLADYLDEIGFSAPAWPLAPER